MERVSNDIDRCDRYMNSISFYIWYAKGLWSSYTVSLRNPFTGKGIWEWIGFRVSNFTQDGGVEHDVLRDAVDVSSGMVLQDQGKNSLLNLQIGHTLSLPPLFGY